MPRCERTQAEDRCAHTGGSTSGENPSRGSRDLLQPGGRQMRGTEGLDSEAESAGSATTSLELPAVTPGTSECII
ncbi:hypothetical protein NDU88_000345 [Pleurodeles waltl]|uniref:Uncharacterized protein n=1 Tax=Pleurodeles waltl TaxID=8319 RepID=A0AAV7TEQ9_PLEWA|nr:hypothetical protein NDU88_000345 [Pleurodeles waltl]